jgi:NADH dehydrogenase
MADELNVVTGAFGYSGSHITRRLVSRGIKVKTLTGHPGRTNPFGEAIEVVPFNFDHPEALAKSLEGATTVFNTYWVRFPRRGMSFERAITNVKTLIEASKRARVRRFVHLSITNASPDSPLPYFRGKGILENALIESGLSYAIIRPAQMFGGEGEILTSNIAWLLRKFPVFAIPGDGNYRIQPVHVDDVAEIAVNAAAETHNLAIDAVGPEVFTFNELVSLIAQTTRSRAHVIHVNPSIALFLASMIGKIMRDALLTRDEIRGLMANLLVSHAPSTAPTRLSEWLADNADTIGLGYHSELAKRG